MLAPSQPPQALILTGDCRTLLKSLPDNSIHCCVTSPPYFGLRDYGVDGQTGLEQTPDAFVAELVAVFREVRRTLRTDGTCWLNLGDSYAGSWGAQSRKRYVASDDPSWHGSQIKNHPKRASNTGTIRQAGVKPKDLYGIPWRVAFALQADGWYLRQDIIWHKPNPMPESVTDRCTKAHEYIFLLTKSEKYFFDNEAIKEQATGRDPGNKKAHKHAREKFAETKAGLADVEAKEFRNKRSVWTVGSAPFKEAHFATFPPALIEPCILAGCPHGGIVLDPFGGAGTTALVARDNGRRSISIELNPAYVEIARRRLDNVLQK